MNLELNYEGFEKYLKQKKACIWDLDYNTDITNDVLGSQTDEEIRKLLQRIKEL